VIAAIVLLAAVGVYGVVQLGRWAFRPREGDRVSDKWLDDNIRERRID